MNLLQPLIRNMHQSFKIRLMVLLLGSLTSMPLLAKVNVLACEPEWDALVREIGGDLVVSSSATTAFQDPHHIEARPSLIAKARRADLVFCTGSELELAWLPLLLRQSGNAKIQRNKPGYLMASELVSRLEVPEVLDRSMGDIHASGNPHVHLDPARVLVIAGELRQRLVEIDAQNREAYEAAFADFSRRWSLAVARWEKKAAPLKGRRVVVYHRGLSYLFSWLGVDVVADLEPKPGVPPSSGHLSRLISQVQTDGADLIVVSAYQNAKGARWLAKRTKLPLVVLPYTVGGDTDANSLFTLFDQSLALLLQEGKVND